MRPFPKRPGITSEQQLNSNNCGAYGPLLGPRASRAPFVRARRPRSKGRASYTAVKLLAKGRPMGGRPAMLEGGGRSGNIYKHLKTLRKEQKLIATATAEMCRVPACPGYPRRPALTRHPIPAEPVQPQAIKRSSVAPPGYPGQVWTSPGMTEADIQAFRLGSYGRYQETGFRVCSCLARLRGSIES